ncbi:MAG: DUF1292 domain-containing protein [Clostridia bacterium]|nr:DUF1292 domain-containing protein [Clostridia bacterium]
MDDRKMSFIDDEGKETICEILFTYHSDEFNKNYVVFMDTETEEVSAGIYNSDDEGEGDLFPVETEEEWAMLEELLEEYAESLEDEDDE